MATAWDTILAKLEWARAGEPERLLRGVEGNLEVAGGRLDRAYIERSVGALELRDLRARIDSEDSA